MTRTETIFLKLLSSALWDSELDNISGVDWSAVLELTNRHFVLPLVADAVLKNNCQGLTTTETMALQNHIYDSVNAHMRIDSVLLKVVEYLKSAELNPVLLKGQGHAAFYREPFLRQCGDIDLYVGPEDYRKAVKMMMQMTGNMEEISESDKHYLFSVDGIGVEIHKLSAVMADPALSGVYSNYESEYLKFRTDTVKIMEKEIPIPEITFNLLYTFYHTWYYFMSGGICFKQICDITILLDRNFNKIDWDRFKEMLASLNLTEPWAVFMYIAVEYLGLEREKALCYEKPLHIQADGMLSMILAEGNLGYDCEKTFFIPKNHHWFFKKIRSLIVATKRHRRLYKIAPKYAGIFYRHFLKKRFLVLFK